MTAAIIEKSIAFLGAIVVMVTTIVQLRADWNVAGLDNNVTKLLLALMAFGCALVILAATNVIGPG